MNRGIEHMHDESNGFHPGHLPSGEARRIASLPRGGPQAHSHRPRIGLLSTSGCLRDGGWPVYAGDAATVHAIFEAGGSPVLIPTLPIVLGGYDPFAILTDEDGFDDVFSVLWQTICSLDGLALAGGGDVYSCFYGQVVHPQAGPPDLWRDLWERYFALAARRLQMPTLGIGRGMHVMNMACGGGLVQDIRAQWPKKTMPPLLRHQARGRRISADNRVEHPVTIHPKSRLASIFRNRDDLPARQSIAAVPSQHHQSVGYITPEAEIVGYLAPELVVGATAPDGVIEAIEDPSSASFWIAVQFHPEWVVHLGWAQRLFASFTGASLAYANQMPRLTSQHEEVRAWLRRFDAGSSSRQADEQVDMPLARQNQEAEAYAQATA